MKRGVAAALAVVLAGPAASIAPPIPAPLLDETITIHYYGDDKTGLAILPELILRALIAARNILAAEVRRLKAKGCQ